MTLTELAEPLLQVVGVHDRNDLYLGVYLHEERLTERAGPRFPLRLAHWSVVL